MFHVGKRTMVFLLLWESSNLTNNWHLGAGATMEVAFHEICSYLRHSSRKEAQRSVLISTSWNHQNFVSEPQKQWKRKSFSVFTDWQVVPHFFYFLWLFSVTNFMCEISLQINFSLLCPLSSLENDFIKSKAITNLLQDNHVLWKLM